MTHHALLGGGRLVRRVHHYRSLLHLPVSGWARLRATIERNLGALTGDGLQGLYRAFIEFHAKAAA